MNSKSLSWFCSIWACCSLVVLISVARLYPLASYETTSVYGFGHPSYYDNVIRSLRGEAVPDTDGREGLHSLEILIATYLSARDGRRVALPLEY